jgi:hypothetical protein
MASISAITGADLIESDLKHLSNRQSLYKQFTASGENGITYDCLLNTEELTTCPRVRVTFGNFSFNIIIDTGSQKEIYRKLKLQGGPMQELPVQSVVLVSAFGNKTKRVKKTRTHSFSKYR